MSFTPLARFRNFTVKNLKLLLEIYPDVAKTMEWKEAADEIEEKLPGYKKTAYQQACQFGIEDRGKGRFRIHNYLFAFDDVNLAQYLKFWIKVYYAPNPYARGNDASFVIYCEIVKEILASPDHEIVYDDFFEKRIGGKSGDILLNAIANYAEPVKVKCNEEDVAEIRIPDNMFIWATMNSADQGVFPMDTAFKRRWEFEYIGINDEAGEVGQYTIPIAMGENRKYVNWNELRMKINGILLSDECRVNEDKLLGPFFISKNVLESAKLDGDKFVKAFENKVIMYLFEDVMKMHPSGIFKGHKGKMIFSEICNTFEEKGEEVFGITDLTDTTEEKKR